MGAGAALLDFDNDGDLDVFVVQGATLESGDQPATLAYLMAASPQIDLRADTRALPLAQEVYRTTGLPRHGAIVALALTELGRCAEAADWQGKMIALAEQKQQADLAAKLRSDLKNYETKGSCRPFGE